jgi:hypothetical protein
MNPTGHVDSAEDPSPLGPLQCGGGLHTPVPISLHTVHYRPIPDISIICSLFPARVQTTTMAEAYINSIRALADSHREPQTHVRTRLLIVLGNFRQIIIVDRQKQVIRNVPSVTH